MDIIHEFNIKTTVPEAFQAFTTEKGINGCWSKNCSISNNVGDQVTVRFTEHNVEMVFRIEEMNEPNYVKWKAIENANPAFLDTIVEFAIEPDNGGVKFNFKHSNWNNQWKGKPNYEQSKETWKHFMNSLKSYLENGSGEPW